MATDAASSLGLINQATNPSKSQIAAKQLTSDYTFFLRMLTTQLKNQDPTEPMDVSDMTQQIATYTGVEQSVQTNSLLEKMIAGQKQSQLATAVSYIGREVETEGNVGTLQYGQDGTQTGTANFDYELPANVNSVTVNIKDASGNIVYTGNGPIAEGKNAIRWNGVNNATGKQMDAGDYTIEVVAKNAGGDVMDNVKTGSGAKLSYAATTFAQATFSYVLPQAAENLKVTITNDKGKAVYSGEGPKVKGRNVVVWDGLNSFTGEAMPAGKYTITVAAKDAQGKDIAAKTYAVGVVNTVETDKDGLIKVTVGDVVVNFDDIVAVREPTPIMT